jgi:hypothetical protein
MHDRHWVGRNRGNYLKSEMSLGKSGAGVNAIVKMSKETGKAAVDNVNARFLASLLFVLLLSLSLSSSKAAEVHAGPLFDQFDLTLETGRRTEIAGPFFYREERETEKIWAVPPFLSYAQDTGISTLEFDFIYPIITYDRYGDQYRWQVFQLLSYSGGPTQVESERDRFTLFPFYFQQRSSLPDQNYTALIPFYGHLKNRLFRDEVYFVMMPLYVQSRKRDVVTDNYVYPFFHLRHGNGLFGWQFWPLVGHEHKQVTTLTNNFDEIETIGGHDKWFVLWPFFANQTAGIGTTNQNWQQQFLPAYSLYRSPARDQTSVLWPFFSWIDEREKKYREWEGPWPFVVIARGEGKSTTRFWPLFSYAHSPVMESRSYLWPVYRATRIRSEPLDRQRRRVLFFLYSDTLSQNTETGTSKRRVDLWPLFTHQRDFNGNTRLQVLAILEPYAPGSHKFERDYSPIWSVWRAEKNPRTGASSQSLLWNLYRRQIAADRKQYSAFFGLYQYQSDSEEKRIRLFYIPILTKKKGASTVTHD